MHWKLCRVPGIYYLMQKCRAQTKGLVVLFSLPVIALKPGDASVYENGEFGSCGGVGGEGWSLKLLQVPVGISCGHSCSPVCPLGQLLVFIPLPQGLPHHCTLPAPLAVLEVSPLEPLPRAPSPWVGA